MILLLLGGWIMSAPLPSALRVRFQQYIEEGLSGRAAALRLKLSPATGARWSRLVQTTGHVRPAPQGRPRSRGKLAPYRSFFDELLEQDADMTLSELGRALEDATGIRVHAASIGRFLRKLGYRYKKSAGGLRTLPGTCETATFGLAPTAHAGDARASGTDCLH